MADTEANVDLSIWEKLRDRVKKAAAAGAKVRVGVLGSAGVHPNSDITMVELAAVHEFGSPAAGIPERSFIRKTMAIRRDEVQAMTRRVAAAYLKGKVDLSQGLGILGQYLSSQIKHTITDELVTPRLSESAAGRRTIARKGSSVTLVDHGHLVNSVSYEVVGAGSAAAPASAGSEDES